MLIIIFISNQHTISKHKHVLVTRYAAATHFNRKIKMYNAVVHGGGECFSMKSFGKARKVILQMFEYDMESQMVQRNRCRHIFQR